MKVILIKNYDKYKVNEIIEVTDGFAKNFLIKNGYAQPVNKKTLANLERVKKDLQEQEEERIAEANALKNHIEKLNLFFSLKSNGNTVHGHVTNKAIVKELLKHDIKIPHHSLSNDVYNTFGNHKVFIKLHPHVMAILAITIIEEK
ncbi:50S ribosomal protein L9 [[Mycoplasma] phocae]|uniref:Large ribosomal subunit protein bL9 n=1 Tax=[Mycoplasma] phocae TaxID=142651 RepID=A0A2Z5IQB4_9BACT|nr:50S ribosomal protein L9 [[Mycoplasma] phocae]AXE60850.1 50S ribosomal protein L9 [[Mycoplasma] phocae]